MFNLTCVHDTCYRRCSTWHPSMAMHPSALRQRLCPYNICFLEVYLVWHGDGLTTWRTFMTLVIGGAQRDVRPWQCIPLPFGNVCAHTGFVSSMFTFSITWRTTQPNVVSHYGQMYRSPDPCLLLFFFFGGYYHLSKYSTVSNTLYI